MQARRTYAQFSAQNANPGKWVHGRRLRAGLARADAPDLVARAAWSGPRLERVVGRTVDGVGVDLIRMERPHRP